MSNEEGGAMRRQQEQAVFGHQRALVWLGVTIGVCTVFAAGMASVGRWELALMFVGVTAFNVVTLSIVRRTLRSNFGLLGWMREQGW